MISTRVALGAHLSKATRLQLGNIKSQYGNVSTAAGSPEKWGRIRGASSYPVMSIVFGSFFATMYAFLIGVYKYYKDLKICSEQITYEDVKDRCLTPMPGSVRLRDSTMAQAGQIMTCKDLTPLDSLPFELKLGYVKQASY